MATQIASTPTNEAFLRKAEQLLCKLNEAFSEMTTTSFSEIYEARKAEVARLKNEVQFWGFRVVQDHTGWRLV